MTAKRDHAKLIYLSENVTQKDIAARVGVSEKTISKWVNEGVWENLKVAVVVTKEQELRRLYFQVKELNDAIELRDKGSRYPNSKEADTLNKLTASIRAMETEAGVAYVVEVAKQLIEWLRPQDFEKAKELTVIFDGFINHKLKGG